MLALRLCRGYLRSCSRVRTRDVQVPLGAMTGAPAMPQLPTIQSRRSLVVEGGPCPRPQTTLMHDDEQKSKYHDQFYLDSLIDAIIILRHRR